MCLSQTSRGGLLPPVEIFRHLPGAVALQFFGLVLLSSEFTPHFSHNPVLLVKRKQPPIPRPSQKRKKKSTVTMQVRTIDTPPSLPLSAVLCVC